jgi:uncharacterized SAM-binding protein YcdF (DUF218 family)
VSSFVLNDDLKQDIEALWGFCATDSGPIRADMLLLLGSHDTRVAERGAELFLGERAAPWVVITGGLGKITRHEWDRPEAEVFRELLVVNGVPTDRILLEQRASNLGENFAFSREIAKRSGMSFQTGIIVCKPYAAKRAVATAAIQWPEIRWHTRPPIVNLWEYLSDDATAMRHVSLMVGNISRFRYYAELGFQEPVAVPAHIWVARQRLVDAGFNQFDHGGSVNSPP